jgi:tRNA(Ile)-lysidine synthase
MPPVLHELERQLSRFLEGQGIDLAEPALVGFSGGPDSCALLAALRALGARELRAIHVDHGLRPAEERRVERELVIGFCRSLSVPLTIASLRPGLIRRHAKSTGLGIEASARAFRHAAFRRCLKERKLRRLYLAHSRDDALETVLMRLLRGAGAGGLRGILPATGPIARPLIHASREEILGYLQDRKLAWSTDSTNSDPAYLRNRLRLRLLPLLDSEFKGWRRALELSASKAALEEEALLAWSRRLEFREVASGILSLGAELFNAAPIAVRLRSLFEAASRLAPASSEDRRLLRGPEALGLPLSSRWAMEALRVVQDPGKRAKGAGIEISHEDGQIRIRRSLDFPVSRGYFTIIESIGPSVRGSRFGGFHIRAGWVAGGNCSGPLKGSFTFPLIIRSRKPGDCLPLQSGSKPLDALLGEWGLSREARDAVPVLEDRSGIVAVLGASLGGRDRYRPGSSTAAAVDHGLRLCISVKGA